ncbi:MAG: DeoR/GlpR transcriptional regulator [Desulfofustis sp.]|nr:DeoR/GlpR transcriptional regulator [Desulfofustis sp.]
MRATERRKQLVNWLDEAGNLSLIEMAHRFGVSKMTIHRDLDLLEQRNALKRIHGGATRANGSLPPLSSQVERDFGQLSQQRCLICNRSPSQNMLYHVSLKNGEQKVACCPHCGISAHLMLGDKVATALTADFLTGRLHSAHRSFFVLGSMVAHCCKPSILTFDDLELAQRFQKGFGGDISNFDGALTFIERDAAVQPGSGCTHCIQGEIRKL